MQAQKLPKFHNKMILLAIILSTFAYLLDQLNVINVSPTIVWFLHGITLFIFETYYLYKNFIGNKIFNILFTGILFPLLISIVISLSIDYINFNKVIICFTSIITSFIFVFTYYNKKSIIKNAFS